jgi:hypothetical protein
MCTVGRSGRLTWIEGLKRHRRCRPERSNPRLGGGGGSDSWPPRALFSSRLLKSAPVPAMTSGGYQAEWASRLPHSPGGAVLLSPRPPQRHLPARGSRVAAAGPPRLLGCYPAFQQAGRTWSAWGRASLQAARPCAIRSCDRGPRRPTIGSRPSREEMGDTGGRQGQGCRTPRSSLPGVRRGLPGVRGAVFSGWRVYVADDAAGGPWLGRGREKSGISEGAIDSGVGGLRSPRAVGRRFTVEARGCREGDSHNVSLELTPWPALARSSWLDYTVDRGATRRRSSTLC